MASFFKKLFGLSDGEGASAPAAAGKSETYADCLLRAAPQKEGAQYRLAGSIEKQVGDALLLRSFIRADLFSSHDDAIDASLRKARQIIDQTGPSLFNDGAASRQV